MSYKNNVKQLQNQQQTLSIVFETAYDLLLKEKLAGSAEATTKPATDAPDILGVRFNDTNIRQPL